jgi:hypothetical protein
MGLKLIIAGTREYTNYIFVRESVDYTIGKDGLQIEEIVSGGARGVDGLGEQYARDRQIPLKVFPADWDNEGKKAGMARNARMAKYADVLIAFPGRGPGTWNMIRQMKALGKPTYVIPIG